MFATISDRLAEVCGAGYFHFHLSPGSTRALQATASAVGDAIANGRLSISPAQRASNDALKQRLKDERWIRHKDIPDPYWAQDKLGFWHSE